MTFFPGFEVVHTEIGDVDFRLRIGGDGPPLLLLHGYPQTHVMWHAVAPVLAESYTVIAPDLPGYGESSAPPSDERHARYSKRAFAKDMVDLMRGYRFDRFRVAGHDRGARVAYRMALDHSGRVEKLAVLDIVPTAEMWQRVDKHLGLVDFHWFFLAQAPMFPERVIAAAPDAFYFRGLPTIFHEEALADYLRTNSTPEAIHAICEDYRAGAGIDHELDEADMDAGARIACPVLALWGTRDDELGRFFDVVEVWRHWADDVRGRPLDCGHYLAEERPEEVAEELLAFFAS